MSGKGSRWNLNFQKSKSVIFTSLRTRHLSKEIEISSEQNKSVKCLRYIDEYIPMNFYCRLMSSIWNVPAIYSCTKTTVPVLFDYIHGVYLHAIFKIVLATSTLWHNSWKKRLPQKNICGGAHSYYNSDFKIHKLKLKI